MFKRKKGGYLAAFLDGGKEGSYGQSRPYKTYALKKSRRYCALISRQHRPQRCTSPALPLLPHGRRSPFPH